VTKLKKHKVFHIGFSSTWFILCMEHLYARPWITCSMYTHPVCYQSPLIHVIRPVWIFAKTAQFWT